MRSVRRLLVLMAGLAVVWVFQTGPGQVIVAIGDLKNHCEPLREPSVAIRGAATMNQNGVDPLVEQRSAVGVCG